VTFFSSIFFPKLPYSNPKKEQEMDTSTQAHGNSSLNPKKENSVN